MRLPKLGSATFWTAVFLDVVVLVALTTVLLNRGKPTGELKPQPTPSAKAEPAKVEPEVSRQVTRRPQKLWFRIVDVADKKPIGLARVVSPPQHPSRFA